MLSNNRGRRVDEEETATGGNREEENDGQRENMKRRHLPLLDAFI